MTSATASPEAWEIAESSGISLSLRESQLPISGSISAYAHRVHMTLEWILYGGEDYVLLGTISASDAHKAKAELAANGLPMFLIGEVSAGSAGVELIRDIKRSSGHQFAAVAPREPIAKRGYNHFAQ